MKKPYIQFLSISFLISYGVFAGLILSDIAFIDIFKGPFYLLLFILGCLGPFISSFIVYNLNNSLGGTKGFVHRFKILGNKKHIYLVPLFLVAHYGFAIILNNVYSYNSFDKFIYYIPVALIGLGSQEIGWRAILQPALEEKKGFWKSIIATGLFWSLWFLPLLFIPGFFILPQFYLHFAIYLVGISFLLTTIYKISGNILYSILLSTLIFSLYPIIVLKQTYFLLALTVLEVILSSMYKNKMIIGVKE